MNWKELLRLPPTRLLTSGIIAGAVFVAVIVGGYQASGSPQLCGACHSMDYVYSRWQISNHKQFACIECHLPDTNLAGQVVYKFKSGLNDLYHETLKTYPAAIDFSAENRQVANGNCLRCHFSTVQNTPMGTGGADCLKCHRFSVHQRGLEKGGGIILGQQ
ncbi:MAG TPA: NapC/NirT family cytochrome c [Syntrophales bacterium]|nr:NapC/NirT family cytochrome c [Syntrophales bacterium]